MKQMTMKELIEWAEDEGTRDQLDAVLFDEGLIDSHGDYASGIDDQSIMVIHWKPNAIINAPNIHIESIHKRGWDHLEHKTDWADHIKFLLGLPVALVLLYVMVQVGLKACNAIGITGQ